MTRDGRQFGSGWISGTIAILAGIAAVATILCFRYPGALTTPELRAWYPLPALRSALVVLIVAGFAMSATSLVLRHDKTLGLIGTALALTAIALGGAGVEVGADSPEPLLGLDWFLLSLVLYSAVFIPLERIASRTPQPILRPEWQTDLAYFFVSAVLVQATTWLTMQPALLAVGVGDSSSTLRSAAEVVGSLPLVAQFIGVVIVADLVQYWVHRAFHTIPILWRFHAIHHSSETLDWLAGGRLHLVDVVLTRGLAFVPIHLLGFEAPAVYAYIVFVSAQATWIHTNLRPTLRVLDPWIVTPRYHHWHHAREPEARDKNFAVHLPILDRLFGTQHLPAKPFPGAYGIDDRVPPGFVRQLLWPLRRSPK